MLKLAIVLMTLCLVSCGSKPIKFRPDVWVGDYKNERILHSKLGVINCSEERFNSYYSISEKDFSELVFILRNGSMPKSIANKINKKIANILKSIKESKKGR